MIRTTIFAGAAALVLVAAGAMAQPNGGMGGPAMGAPGAGEHTMDFVTRAAQSDEFERREGRLAADRAHDSHVRDFANMMVQQHAMTTADLKMAVRNAGMTPPPPPMLTPDQMRMMDDLKRTHGHDFDRTYMQQQVQAHQMALDNAQSYAQSGRPGPIRDAAAKLVPIIQQHLQMAQDIQGHMG